MLIPIDIPFLLDYLNHIGQSTQTNVPTFELAKHRTQSYFNQNPLVQSSTSGLLSKTLSKASGYKSDKKLIAYQQFFLNNSKNLLIY